MGKPKQTKRIDQREERLKQDSRDLAHSFAQHRRVDGWQNIFTGLGQLSRDKRLTSDFISNRIVDEIAEEVWRGDPIFATIVEKPVDVIIAAGWELLIQPSKRVTPKAKALDAALAAMQLGDDMSEVVKGVNTYLTRLHIKERLARALYNSRAKGGGALFLNVDDGQDTSTPLDLSKVKSVRDLVPLEPMELIPFSYNRDPFSSRYGEGELFYYQRLGGVDSTPRLVVHHSRIVFFPGVVVSRRQTRERWGWGDSMLVRVWDDLRDFHQSYGASSLLVVDFSQAVMKIDKLADLLRSGKKDAIIARAQAMERTRSIARAILIDKDGESFERQTTQVAGLRDMVGLTDFKLSSSSRIPVTILMGQAPAGLNATGDSDIRNWYKDLESVREKSVRGPLEQVTQLVLNAADGPTLGIEPEHWEYEFPSIWTPTEKEKAEIKKLSAEKDAIEISSGVLIPEEVTRSKYGGRKWSPEITLDAELRSAFDKEEAARKLAEAERQAALINGAQNGPVA